MNMMKQIWFGFALLAAYGLTSFAEGKRPTYNIAHMVNAVKQIDEWLGYGANALEADVKFSKSTGAPEYFSHGIPCDAFRDCLRWAYINNYVNALRDRTLPSSRKLNRNLVMTMFDCKLASLNKNLLMTAGEKFANDILIPLYKNNPTKMKVIISFPNSGQVNFVRGILKELRSKQPSTVSKIGYDISWDDKGSEYKQKMLSELGISTGHGWLSSGITNFSPKKYLDELKGQVRYRDRGRYFSKVYAWSVDKKSTAVEYLNLGLDGIITNEPGVINQAIREVGARLATLDDDPFRKYA